MTPRILRPTKAFRKSLKRMRKQGRDLGKLTQVLDWLADRRAVPLKYRDHELVGDWTGRRELHIEPDWLLVYAVSPDDSELHLIETGTHADLFR